MRINVRKLILVTILSLSITCIIYLPLEYLKLKNITGNIVYILNKSETSKVANIWSKEYLLRENLWNYRNFSQQKIDSLSLMGRRLFLHENIGKTCLEPKVIYVYKYGNRLKARLVKNYCLFEKDPFRDCSVSCQISYKIIDFERADAVLFHLHLLPNSSFELKRKNHKQIWIWMSDESPYNTLMMAKNKDISQFDNLFNWSMTYRSTSDIPVPYGRTVPIVGHSELFVKNMFKEKEKLVAVLGSNCSGRNHRWKYIRQLLKYIHVDIYGSCGKGMPKCPGHFHVDCKHIEGYKFYLSFENSNCLDYITEKLWWNAFEKEAIPVVLGASKKNYLELLPPNSFIFVEDFRYPKELAQYLMYLSSNETAFNAYHNWRKKFRVINEHGYFKTSNYHYCRLCEALHYNSRATKVFESMKSYWNKERDCYNAIWDGNDYIESTREN